ncbi:MAG: hypothetical protein ACK4NO_01965 [Glycocaulis sp.]
MKQPLFTMLPFSVPNPALPVIPSADFVRLRPNLEYGAYGHWLFGGSSASLAEGVNGRALTLQSDGVSYPNASYLNMSMTLGKALISDFGEVAAQTDTICAVVRLNQANDATRTIIGSINTTTGGSIFVSAGPALFQNQRGFTSAGTQSTGVAQTTDWRFMAMSRDFASATRRTAILIGGSTEFVVNPTGTYAPTPGAVALGSAYSLGGTAGLTMDVAEFQIYSHAMGTAELATLYQRSRDRMALRGITVV